MKRFLATVPVSIFFFGLYAYVATLGVISLNDLDYGYSLLSIETLPLLVGAGMTILLIISFFNRNVRKVANSIALLILAAVIILIIIQQIW